MLYDGGKRLYYMGPMFRHERPQRGRYRQFHQIGAEALGFAGPDVDAEMILLADALWKELGLRDVRLEINSLGQPDERKQHRAALIAYLEQHADLLDEDARRRLHSNPLRILDTKNPAMQALVEGAPKLIDFLGEASLAHFERPARHARRQRHRLPHQPAPGARHGLLQPHACSSSSPTAWARRARSARGGRYDYLIEQIGGKPAPAVGWALGVERVLELVKEQGAAIRAAGAGCLCRRARRRRRCRWCSRRCRRCAPRA